MDRAREAFLRPVKDQLAKTNANNSAPSRLMEVVEAALGKGPQQASQLEAKLFAELASTPQTKAMLGLANDRARCRTMRPYTSTKQQLECPVVNQLGIVGANHLGVGIAASSVATHLSTCLYDTSRPALARGEEAVHRLVANWASTHHVRELDRTKVMSMLESSAVASPLVDCDLVIDASAVVEVSNDLGLASRQKLVKELEPLMERPQAVLAIGTSTCSVNEIGQVSMRPEQFIGMHYMAPVDECELLELILAPSTSDATIAAALDVGLRQGKTVIIVKDEAGKGCYTTRLLGQLLSELVNLVLHNDLSIDQLDVATRKLGWSNGSGLPCLFDRIGLDQLARVGQFCSRKGKQAIQGDELALVKALVASGVLGVKSGGRGFLVHGDNNSSQSQVNADAEMVIAKHRKTSPDTAAVIAHNKPEDCDSSTDPVSEMIQRRLLLRLVNEAVACLQDGTLVNGARGGDVGAVYGLGFPTHLGGPFRYVDQVGAAKIVNQLREFVKLYGSAFEPCELLTRHAKNAELSFHGRVK